MRNCLLWMGIQAHAVYSDSSQHSAMATQGLARLPHLVAHRQYYVKRHMQHSTAVKRQQSVYRLSQEL